MTALAMGLRELSFAEIETVAGADWSVSVGGYTLQATGDNNRALVQAGIWAVGGAIGGSAGGGWGAAAGALGGGLAGYFSSFDYSVQSDR